MTSTALAVRGAAGLPSAADYNTMMNMAETLMKSGFLPAAIKNPAAALVIMQKGRELDIPPMYAISNIAIIQGKPSAGAELLLALIYRDHGDDAIRFTESHAERCTISYKRRNWKERSTYSFTAQDAVAAGLVNDNWKKYKPAMLRARCVSAVARMGFPDSIGGMYTPEELGAAVEVADDGEIRVMAGPVTEPRRATPQDIAQTASEPRGAFPTIQHEPYVDEDGPVYEPTQKDTAARQNEPVQPAQRVQEPSPSVIVSGPSAMPEAGSRREKLFQSWSKVWADGFKVGDIKRFDVHPVPLEHMTDDEVNEAGKLLVGIVKGFVTRTGERRELSDDERSAMAATLNNQSDEYEARARKTQEAA